MENLPFKECELADEVVKRGCITEDECNDIRQVSDRKTQVRNLLLLVKNRSYKTMENFLEAAKTHCPSIVEDIWDIYCKLVAKNRAFDERKCWLCKLKSYVDVKRVLDLLWSEGVLDEAVVHEINMSKEVVGRQDKHWEAILNEIANAEQPGLKLLCEALEENGHYTHISREIRNCPRRNDQFLSCMCYPQTAVAPKSRSFSINSDESILPEDSSHSEEELSPVESNNTNEIKPPHLDDNNASSTDHTEISFVHEVQCSNGILASRNTYDPPKQKNPIRRNNLKNQRRGWLNKLFFFCNPRSFAIIDEVDEEGDNEKCGDHIH